MDILRDFVKHALSKTWAALVDIVKHALSFLLAHLALLALVAAAAMYLVHCRQCRLADAGQARMPCPHSDPAAVVPDAPPLFVG